MPLRELIPGRHRSLNTTGVPAGRQQPTTRTHHYVSSSVLRGQEQRNEMFNSKSSRRNDRTFIGSDCAACEEPLEHMLRGERVLQLTCGHVAHEACFYEYIKEFQAQTCPTCEKPLGLDTSRGGNLDFDNLNKLARSTQTPTPQNRSREDETTPVPWETKEARRPSVSTQRTTRHQASREHLLPEKTRTKQTSSDRYDSYSASPVRSHQRTTSDDSEALPRDYTETHQTKSRRPESVQSVQTSATDPKNTARNPIPSPLVTVRSEFPTLNKSRHQQSLTCLVTVEVLEGKWHPRCDDIRSLPPVPSTISEEPFEPPVLPFSVYQKPVDSVHEDSALDEARDDLLKRVDNWHGLEFERFGKLLLHGRVRVGKDRQTWQELECYLFSEMLICVKEKRLPSNADNLDGSTTRLTLKGSILIKKHLNRVETSPENDVLTLALSVVELPVFHLHFREQQQLEGWRKCLYNIIKPEPPVPKHSEYDNGYLGSELEDEFIPRPGRASMHSSGYGRSPGTAPTEYTSSQTGSHDLRLGTSSIHIPLDIVVVIPVSSSMQGLKMNLLRDSLRFMISSLGERDRLGLVSFGSGGGGVPLIGLTNKTWSGWSRALESIRPIAHKNMRSDVIEGANGAMDMLMQRRNMNQLSHIILISDSATSDNDSIDFVVSRAEAAKISIHSFGLGLTHKPDSMVEMSTRTKASYTYVKDWMMLRECLAGCLGALQSTSHQNVKLKLRLPEGSPAKFVKITGALQVTKRATGKDAEASLGDLRFGDKRDILVQLAIQPDNSSNDLPPVDPWQNIISGLEAMGPLESETSRRVSIEELPLLQADLVWCDLLREGTQTQLPRPSLLAITMLPSNARHSSLSARPGTPPIPPHPSVVQRRMELLTSDMLSRALGLVARGQHDRALHLLNETRSILKGLGKGGLPPLPTPPPSGGLPPTPRSVPPTPGSKWGASPTSSAGFPMPPTSSPVFPAGQRTPSPSYQDVFKPFSTAAEIDKTTVTALDSELESSLEWISHPGVFARDVRKGVLQAIGTINSQRGYTFRTPSESLWAIRIPGVRRLGERSREWREVGDESLLEE